MKKTNNQFITRHHSFLVSGKTVLNGPRIRSNGHYKLDIHKGDQ